MVNVIRENIRLFITIILASVASAFGPSIWLPLLTVLVILIAYAAIEAWVTHPRRSGGDHLLPRMGPGIGATYDALGRWRVGLVLFPLLLVATFFALGQLLVVHLYDEPSLLTFVFALMLTGNALLLDLCWGFRQALHAHNLPLGPARRWRSGVSALATAAITVVPCVLLVADPAVPSVLIGVWVVATGAKHAIPVWWSKTAGPGGASG